MGDKYRIIRNSDGSAHIMTHRGKHVATHDTISEANEHHRELCSEGKESNDPYYEHSQKNKGGKE